ncbi:helicase C-terminal domain protein [Aeromicrobium marinum DSM 15272]|uniref:Helicase C-terminal domain protein n=1 Tax=Aeromicrobium marinum DSM 15272 TaxID=585531 RepID=E2SE03_9ACTN|nr:DEAD/DEAH box helicase [Aeromicrobium marinum]EFQ82730.1 helicase C-terminal domain protein [Aeromicrobium marinum DSM 15272]
MTTIHAELTAGGESIVLLAGGTAAPADMAAAARLLATLTPLFTKSNPPGALVVPATWPAVVQLSAAFGAAWVPGPRLQAWILDQAAARQQPAEMRYTPPQGLVPFHWQADGAAMVAATGQALFTDEPGTGKTITAILGLVEHGRMSGFPDDGGPVIVVCPASVVDPWVEAWRTWAPHVRTVAWRGAPKARHTLAGTADVYVVSYDTARADVPPVAKASPLRKLGAAHLVIDECHLIKNPRTERSKSVHRLASIAAKKGGAVVALSGTPITHNPGDLWSALACLMPDAWPSKERWVARYCQSLSADYGEEILGLLPYREAEFRLTLLGQHRRVAKADVLTELPPKVYSVRTVDMPPKWRKVYDDFEAEMLAELPDGTELQVMDVMSKFGHLSRLASAAADVEVTYGPDVDQVTGLEKRHVSLTLKDPSWKVDALLEVLDERPGQPVVVFAPSRQLVTLAGEAAAKAGLRVGYIVGGQTMTERTATVTAFQGGELDVVCVTTGAGGVGLTLTAAKTVVFLQRPWSLVESIQAEDRCHRIGSEQHDCIEIVDIVARNTIDTRVRAVLRERAGQLADLVQDPRIVSQLLGGADLKAAS